MLVCLLMPLGLAGCLERKLSITSEPPGALVYANDIELGRTPLEADFTYYGKYDVRVELEGHEPLRTMASADAPLYEIPPFDLVAMALPFTFEKTVRWHFDLKPMLESTLDSRQLEDELVARARELRGMTLPAESVTTPVQSETAPDAAIEPSSERPNQ